MTAAAALLAVFTVAQAGLPCDDAAESAARWGTDADAVRREAPRLAPALLHAADAGAQVEARLGTACEVDAAWNSGAGVAPSVNRALLEDIYARPEFAHARSRKDAAFDQFLRRARAFLEELFGTRGAVTFAEVTRVLVLALALAALVGGVLRLIAVRRGRRGAGRSALADAGAPLELSDPSVHLQRARDALAGDSREAIRQALLALLSSLERRRWARPDRVKTNRELAAELPKRGAPAQVTAEVERIVRWYDRTFYSMAAVAPDEARRFVDEVAALDGRMAGGGA